MGKWFENTHFTGEDIWLTNEHREKCLTPFVIWKMQFKTTMRNHYTPIKMFKIRKDQSRGRTETLIHYLWGYEKMVQLLGKQSGSLLKSKECSYYIAKTFHC